MTLMPTHYNPIICATDTIAPCINITPAAPMASATKDTSKASYQSKFSAAFTLIELSIVLVILGLIVGGVLAGRTLIRSAELRSITTEQGKYLAAVMTFKDKYYALPGDMTNATQLWGAANAVPATCETTPSTDKRTCNGNGNIMLDFFPESMRAWQHLANAGLIEGRYSGVDDFDFLCTNANCPESKLPRHYWLMIAGGEANPSGLFGPGGFLGDGFYLDYGDNMMIISSYLSGGLDPIELHGKLSPKEVLSIDQKVDDGKPANGRLVVGAPRTPGGLSLCTNTNDEYNLAAAYLVTSEARVCSLIFRQQF